MKKLLTYMIFAVVAASFAAAQAAVDSTGCIVIGKRKIEKTEMVAICEKAVTVACEDERGGVFYSSRKKVKIPSGYAIGKYPVTQELFEAVMGANPSAFTEGGAALGAGETDAKYRPVEQVSWYDAIAFCNKLSILLGKTPCYKVKGIDDWANLPYDDIPKSINPYWDNAFCDWKADGFRLPAQTEWEFAARGGDPDSKEWRLHFAGSDRIDEVAWHAGNSENHTWQVGLKKPNKFGLYDMTGNVLEWCWDNYNKEEVHPLKSLPWTGLKYLDPADSSAFKRFRRGGNYATTEKSGRGFVYYYIAVSGKKAWSGSTATVAAPFKRYDTSTGFRVAATIK